MSIKDIIKISRPRFWLYTAGPFLIGFSIASVNIHDFDNFLFFYSLFYFLIPANFFIYGINDLSDTDTDKFNVKKTKQEIKVSVSNINTYRLISFSSLLFSIPLFIHLPVISKIYLFLFLLISFFYSSQPFRFKSKPFIDFSSNILYAIPGFIGFTQISKNEIPLLIFFLTYLWTGAMHLFSAIPDIDVDRKAKLNTTAVVYGKNNSLIFCLIFWSLASFLAIKLNWLFIISLVYPAIPLLLLKNKKMNIVKIYWYFPYINLTLGFLLFLFTFFKLK